jgi:hypothetical protein
MPAELLPGGEPFTQQLHLRVHPLGNRELVKAQGPVRQTITHDGSEILDSPSGPVAAQRITLIFDASLPPAEVHNRTRRWFDQAGRLIAEEREERTRILGVPSRLNRESWILSDPPSMP